MSGWIWAAIGAAAIFIETVAPGYFLIFLAPAALAVALATLFGVVAIDLQLLLFAVVLAIVFVASFRSYRRLLGHGVARASVNSSDRLIGERGVVEDPIVAGRGKVRLNDSVWLAHGPELPAGRSVRVVAVDGTVLVVEPLAG